MNPIKCALLIAGLLMVPACNGLGYPGVFNGSAGSCLYPATDGYDSCQDFLGSDYNSEVGQSLCANVIMGAWSSNPCVASGALGTCVVVPIGTGDSQTVQYTYYPSPDPDAGTANVLTVETACGVAGGVFTPAAAQ